MVIDKLPFDKYELEPSPLTQYILERKSPHMCWQVGQTFTYPSALLACTACTVIFKKRFTFTLCPQVFVSSSGKQNDLGQPFGYLKASTTLTCVNLFVMPYNFPVLLPLLGKTYGYKPFFFKWPQNLWVSRSELILNLKSFPFLEHIFIWDLSFHRL